MGNNSVRVALRPQEFLVMAIKHVPSMCQNFTSLPRRFPLLRPSPPLSRRNPSTCLGRHRIACSYARRMSMSRRLAAATYTVRRAQRTHGTTDPGGVWRPVHRRECLTILKGTRLSSPKNGQIRIGTDDEPDCIRYSLLVPVPRLPCSYRVLLRVEQPPTTPVQAE